MLGERTSSLLSYEMQKLLAGAVLVSPYIPMLFMGEEWGASSPFLYFVSHTDSELIEAVRKGRKEEFKEFHAQGEAPDPQSAETFIRSKIPWQEANKRPHSIMLAYYKALIDFRKKHRDFLTRKSGQFEVYCHESYKIIALSYRKNEALLLCVMNFSPSIKHLADYTPDEELNMLFNSADPRWIGKHSLPVGLKKGMPIQLPPESITIYSNKHV